MRGPPGPRGVRALRAECRWPEGRLDALVKMLSRFEAYAELIDPILFSTVVRVDGDRSLVHQRQATPGVADREMLLWMQVARFDDGGARISWDTASGEPLAMAPGSVRAAHNDGFWEVRRHPDGGLSVVHQVAYDPGGAVPSWLVTWFSGTGFRKLMARMRVFAATDKGGRLEAP